MYTEQLEFIERKRNQYQLRWQQCVEVKQDLARELPREHLQHLQAVRVINDKPAVARQALRMLEQADDDAWVAVRRRMQEAELELDQAIAAARAVLRRRRSTPPSPGVSR